MVLLSKSKSFGTRAGRPTNGICYVGGACAFRLLLYDIDDQPVKVGGLMHNMSIRLGTEQIHPMIEGHMERSTRQFQRTGSPNLAPTRLDFSTMNWSLPQ